MSTSAATLYQWRILAEAPRLFGLLDRDPASRTYGCFDRPYWAWKFVDFPGSRFQEGVCVAAYLATTRFDGNPHFEAEPVVRWIAQAIRFWTGLQHSDGSFDEAYPNERSLAATAFTAFYVSEALGFLGDRLDAETRARARDTLARAGGWLERNDESHGFLSNHLAAAAAALTRIARVTGDDRFDRRSRYFVARILSHQSPEGWYDEYGGADPGYQSHGTFYLARIWQLGRDAELAESLRRANAFFARFLHPDGSLGGEYTSRNTQTYYPAAFEMLRPIDPAAGWIADVQLTAVESGAAAGLRGIDAQNYFPCLNNLVFAALAAPEGGAPRLAPARPEPTPFAWFPSAGLGRVERPGYVAFFGTSQGGVLKVFDRRRGALLASDAGYLGRTTGGATVSTQYFDRARETVATDRTVETESRLQTSSRPVMTPWRFLGFRVFTLTVGRWPAVGRWLKKLLVHVLIYRRRAIPVRLKRTIVFEDFAVRIRDRFEGDPAGLASLERVDSFGTIHMGSARYFVPHELRLAGPGDGVVRTVPLEAIRGGVVLERVIAATEGAD
jgi:hypothetical protein